MVRPWFAKHSSEDATRLLAEAGVLVGGFQTFEELVKSDPRCSTENPMLTEIDQPGVGRVLAPRVPLKFGGSPAADAMPAPPLGGDTEAVLESELALDDGAQAEPRLTGRSTSRRDQ